MKTKILLILAIFAFCFNANAQSPYSFNYQSVIRDAGGNVLANTNVGLQLTILKGSATGLVTYQENHNLTSNDFGLIHLQIGTGIIGFGEFDTLLWGEGPYFMQVGMDFSGGANYQTMGTTQLVSVPYALHARTADSIVGGNVNEGDPIFGASIAANISSTDTSNWNAHTMDTDTQLDSTGIASLGFVSGAHTTDTQLSETDVDAFVANNGYLTTEVDGDTTNEIQTLTIGNDTLYLSGGGYVKLPVSVVGFNGQYTNLIGAPVNVSHFTNDAGYLITEMDGDPTNEIQTLSFNNDTMYLSNGGGVDLSGYDNSAAINLNAVAITGNTSNISTNTGNISTNNSGIASNVTAISTNASGVSANGTAISGNTSSISTNNTAIGGNTTNITANASTMNTHILNDLDTDSSNEIQSLSLLGTSLSISGGNTVNLRDASVWDTNAIGAYYLGSVGIGTNSPAFKLHVMDDSVAIYGLSSAQTSNNWQNIGVHGDVNTASNPGRGVFGSAYGANYGMAVRGEASTGAENHGVSGISLSTPSNSINQFGVYGEARKGWSAVNAGTGNHWGGYFISTGSGGFTVGASGTATTLGTGSNRGISGTANSNTASDNFGTIGFASGTISGINRGAYGQASNSTGTNYGMQGVASGAGLNQTGVYGYSNGTAGNNYGVDGTTEATGAENVGTGGFAYGINTGSNKNFGMYGFAQNADTNYGVYATVTGADNVNYGVYSEVDGGTINNYAVYGKNSSTGSSSNSFGVYGLSDGVSTSSNWGINGSATGSAGTGSQNTGVLGSTDGAASFNIGVLGNAFGTGTSNYGVYSIASNGTNNYAGYFSGDVTITGNLNVTGSIAKGSGTFKIDHPLDPENKYLVHSFVESPEMMNIYSGNITTDAQGFATVELPAYFDAANKDFRYQLTVMGSFAQAIIKEKISDNKFVVQTNNPNIEVSWQVTGVRSDKYAEANRVVVEVEKTKKGTYLHPEVYGMSADKSENADSENLNQGDSENVTNSSSSSKNNISKLLEEKKKSNNVIVSPIAEEKSIQEK